MLIADDGHGLTLRTSKLSQLVAIADRTHVPRIGMEKVD